MRSVRAWPKLTTGCGSELCRMCGGSDESWRSRRVARCWAERTRCRTLAGSSRVCQGRSRRVTATDWDPSPSKSASSSPHPLRKGPCPSSSPGSVFSHTRPVNRRNVLRFFFIPESSQLQPTWLHHHLSRRIRSSVFISAHSFGTTDETTFSGVSSTPPVPHQNRPLIQLESHNLPHKSDSYTAPSFQVHLAIHSNCNR